MAPERSNREGAASALANQNKALADCDLETLTFLADSLETTLLEDSDRKKSAEQRATSILTGSAFSLALMFTAVSIACSMRPDLFVRIQGEWYLMALVFVGIVSLAASDILFLVTIVLAARTLRPREIMNYSVGQIEDQQGHTRRAFLEEKVDSLRRCIRVWDNSASAAVQELNRTLCFFQWALGLLFLTILAVSALLFAVFC